MIFEALAEYIESNFSHTTLKLGTNLFVNHMPSDAPLAVMLKNSYAGLEIDPDIPTHRRGKIVLVVRGQDDRRVKELAHALSDFLTIAEVKLTDAVMVRSIRPMTEPLMYPVSVSNQVEMSVNLSVIYARLG